MIKQIVRSMPRAVVPLLLLSVFGVAHADQDVQSSDGQWKLHAKLVDSLLVKKSAEALINITSAAGGKGCPTLQSVAFEMPAHGHGGELEPKFMSIGNCEFHITNLSPSMGGTWRLRLVLQSADKASNADFTIPAK